MDLKQIRITESVKAELDSLKLDNDSYSTIIRRIISENTKLKADNERLFNISENLSSKN